jgi:hypothetical protein
MYSNYLERFENNIFVYFAESAEDGFSLQNIRAAVSRCCSGNSVEEIFENLRREAKYGLKDWAGRTLEALEKRPRQGLELTLTLLRQAEGLEWSQCIELEYKIANNLAKAP